MIEKVENETEWQRIIRESDALLTPETFAFGGNGRCSDGKLCILDAISEVLHGETLNNLAHKSKYNIIDTVYTHPVVKFMDSFFSHLQYQRVWYFSDHVVHNIHQVHKFMSKAYRNAGLEAVSAREEMFG